jgi:hypothetical protein
MFSREDRHARGGEPRRFPAGQGAGLVRNTKPTRPQSKSNMAVAAASAHIVATAGTEREGSQDAASQQSLFPFLRLPRELRDQV